MLIAVWSVKGGVGVTSVAAMLALGVTARADEALLVDLCGDVPAVLGIDDDEGPGAAEWAVAETEPQALGRLETQVAPGLAMVRRGAGPLDEGAARLAAALADDKRHVVVDCGRIGEGESFARTVVASSARNILVTRRCFLSLRAAQQASMQPDGVIVLDEAGRFYTRTDVEAATSAPVIATIAVDGAVATRIDAGLLRGRLPRTLLRAMSKVVAHAA